MSDWKTSYERREQKSYRKALDPFGELVIFAPMEKPKDRSEARNHVGIMLGLVDKSDEVVTGTSERVVNARTVYRMLAGQRGDATYGKSIRGVPWQPNPGMVAEGELLEMSKLAELVFRWFQSRKDRSCSLGPDLWREVELAKYGFSDDFEMSVRLSGETA